MKTRSYLLVLACCLWATTQVSGAERSPLDPRLEPLRPLLDKTWKGAFKRSTPEKPVVDVMRWERALNGKAVRVLHSVNNGGYGGETIFMWDEASRTVRYHYFTTAGFMTTGSLEFKDGRLHTHEVLAGGSGAVTEVRGVSELLPDGAFLVRTEHMIDGKWQAGREVTYREDSAAKVIFK